MTEQNNMTADERYCFDCIHNEVCRYCPREYCDYKEQACTLESTNADGWISVKDRLPENRDQVMVYGLVDSIFQYGVKDEICIIGRYREDYQSWWFPVKINFEVTHWRPLPEPPKGG